MGTVVAAWDNELGRTVAFKSARDEGARAALKHEGALAARLEHPGIVPVYDAGADPEGAPWFAMRLVRGRTFEDELARPDRPGRAVLIRHLLAAVQAVAFAHSRGVVHRDLKPSNILVGSFGETQVADWGLATVGGQGAHGVVGTPRWMSPEQRQALGAGPASDVYSFGAILGAILAATDGEGTSRELESVCRRATQEDPSHRYPTGTELAQDLERWLDGQRVAAHRYSILERFGRLGRRFRAALFVAAAASVLISITLVVGTLRTRAQRDRAVRAEQEAVAARGRAETNLAQALVVRAQSAAQEGLRPEAERLAYQALKLGASADARGVFVFADVGPRPDRIDVGAPPEGTPIASGPGSLVLARGKTAVVLDEVGTERFARTFVEDPLAVVLSDGTTALWSLHSPLVLLPSTGAVHEKVLPQNFFPQWVVRERDGTILLGRATQVWEVGPGSEGLEAADACAEGAVALSAFADHETMILCSDRTIARRADTTQPFHREALDTKVGRAPARVAPWGSDAFVLVTDFGDAHIVERQALHVRVQQPIVDHPLVSVITASDRGLAVLRSDRGLLWLWRPSTGERTPLPGRAAAAHLDGATLHVAGTTRSAWSLPRSEPAPLIDLGVGVSCLDLHPEGNDVALCRGDGHVTVWEPRRGALRTVEVVAGTVVKDAAWTKGGFVAARAGLAGPEGALIEWDQHWTRASSSGPETARRVIALADGDLMSLPWGRGGPVRHGADSVRAVGLPGEYHDLSASPDRRRWVICGFDGVRTGTVDGAPSPPLAGSEDSHVASIDNAGAVVFGGPRGVLAQADGRTWVLVDAPTSPTAVAIDARHVAAADLMGMIYLWDRRGDLLARWQGHDARVTGLALDGRGGLYSASWDGRARRWSVGVADLGLEDLGEVLRRWED